MTARVYRDAVLPRLAWLAETQLPAIEAAGVAVADAIGGGGRVWVAKTSHGVHDELTYRAGGFMAIHGLDDPIVIQPGDVLIIPTNAGTTVTAVDLANVAHERGAKVIALTQLPYEQDPAVIADHPSGKKVHQVSDIVVDLGGQTGDGELALGAMRVIPGSGVAMNFAAWLIMAEALALLNERGTPPLMWESMQITGAMTGNLERLGAYRRTGLGIAEPQRD
jgi:uncharacterized phosphosugar-binding protein